MARLDSFLRLVAEQHASDLHFHAGGVPLIRHDGELMPLPFRQLSELETRRFVSEILTPTQQETLDREQQVDFMYVLPEVGRFRANVFMQSRGLGAAFRVIRRKVPTLEELGLPPALRKLMLLQNGLVIITGPTGAGKTTTLAAMIHEINRESERHVITIEDPIEFVHEPIKSAITHREVGSHTESFGAGLRAALRESPDVLVLGEMRDLETVSLALQAAETGALVLGTLHTNSAAKAVDRILDVIPEESREQARGTLSLVLRGVVAQQLARLQSGEGRLAVLEILISNYAIANMIRENKVHQIDALLQTAGNDGSGNQGFDAALFRHIQEGLLADEEALRLASYPDVLRRQLAELPQGTLTPDEARRVGLQLSASGDFAGAGAAFEAGGHHMEAALEFERGGDPARAFTNLLRVPPTHASYREACTRAIRMAPSRGPLGIGFENLIASFIKQGPVSGYEMASFVALARLYEAQGFIENAFEALQQVLRKAPGHPEASAALREMQRNAPPATPPLPGLPDLPDLPAPPKSAAGAAGESSAGAASDAGTDDGQPFRVGATIAGRYRLEQKIGSGGMSVVFRATDLQLEDQIAMKVFTRAVFDAETDARLRRELSLSRLLVHPNVVRLYAIGMAFGFRYITLELLSGIDLADRIRDTPLPLGEGLDYLIQACAGLQAAHDLGIVHRDMKPENCFITREGQLKIMDFGIAKLYDTHGLTATGMVAGTPAYMAPEQALNFSSVGPAADQYAIGVVAFEMFTATRPFVHAEPVPLMMMHANQPPPTPRSRNRSLPEELDRIIMRCLEKDPAARFPSCRQLMWELERVRQKT